MVGTSVAGTVLGRGVSHTDTICLLGAAIGPDLPLCEPSLMKNIKEKNDKDHAHDHDHLHNHNDIINISGHK